MFNSQIYFGPDGALIGKHQKIMPTVGELAHAGGYGDTFGRFADRVRPDERPHLGGELQSAGRIRALTAEGTRIHVMSWPNHFPVSGDPLRDGWRLTHASRR
jgi:aliphatic nitrilase